MLFFYWKHLQTPDLPFFGYKIAQSATDQTLKCFRIHEDLLEIIGLAKVLQRPKADK